MSVPSQAFDRARPRLVFAADPTRIAAIVDVLKQKLVVYLAGAGLIAPGIVGKLHVSNARQVPGDGSGELTLRTLHVIDIVLEPKIWLADSLEEIESLVGPGQMEAGNVIGVDRFDQQLDSGSIECAGGEPQIFGNCLFDPSGIDACRSNSDETIELAALQRARILDRRADAVLDLALASGQTGDATLAFGPIPGR